MFASLQVDEPQPGFERFQLALCSREVEEVPGPGTRLEIKVREPAVRHVVTVAQLQRWVAGPTRSPAERVRRDAMRELLDAKPAGEKGDSTGPRRRLPQSSRR